ncbi:MAG: AraC family transcriptional regulator [Gammaproteobacteria bacterium]
MSFTAMFFRSISRRVIEPGMKHAWLLCGLSAICLSTPIAADTTDYQTLDGDVQALKQEVLELNRELFIIEEELLFPANTQVAVFVSMDTGNFFSLDSVQLTIDDKKVSNYLYTRKEVEALYKGGVQRLYLGNLKAGEHELVAVFTGTGPHGRDYRRATSLIFEKGMGARFLELSIADSGASLQPEFQVREWE